MHSKKLTIVQSKCKLKDAEHNNIDRFHSCSVPNFYCVTDSLEFEIRFVTMSLNRCHLWSLYTHNTVILRWSTVRITPRGSSVAVMLRQSIKRCSSVAYQSRTKTFIDRLLSAVYHIKSVRGHQAQPEFIQKARSQLLRKWKDFRPCMALAWLAR